jgi:hypothetical protein
VRTCKYIVLAEDGHGSMNDEAILVVDTLEEAVAFVKDPPPEWRGHVQTWPYGLAVYVADRLDEDEIR